MVVLLAAAAGAGFLVSQTFAQTADAASGTDLPTSAAPVSAEPTAEPTAEATDGAVPDPRATGTAPVTTEPPDDVATDEPAPAPRGSTDVVIGYADAAAGAVQVNAFVPGIVEDGGTCTLTLSRGGDSRTATAAAGADATTTICDLLAVPAAGLAPGTWEAVVAYAGTVSGTSDPVEVALP